MIYIYDSIPDSTTGALRRYGKTYLPVRRARMGDHTFFIYDDSGDQMMVVPEFAVMYREAEKKYKKFPDGKELSEYLKLISRTFSRKYETEEYSRPGGQEGTMHLITLEYKDIGISFEYEDRHLTLVNVFEILRNNVFGNGQKVTMDE